MTHDDHDAPPSSTVNASANTSSPDATVNAFAAAITAGLHTFGAWRDRFQKAADEAAVRDSLLAYLRYRALANEEQEDAIRKRYPRAVLDWNQLETRLPMILRQL